MDVGSSSSDEFTKLSDDPDLNISDDEKPKVFPDKKQPRRKRFYKKKKQIAEPRYKVKDQAKPVFSLFAPEFTPNSKKIKIEPRLYPDAKLKPLNGFNFDEKANEFSPLKSEAAVFQPHAQEFKSSANEKFHISPYAKEYKLESLEFKPSFLSGFDSERQNKIFAPSNEELERYFKPKLSASASEFNLK